MKDPYEVLGVSRNASESEIKNAYRALAKKYHPDNYNDSPLKEVAEEKMQEINEAYDAIMSGKKNSSGTAYSYDYNDETYNRVIAFLNAGDFDSAERLLEGIEEGSRSAKWYYLKGQVNYKRGWTDQAYTYFSMAYKMEPGNTQYKDAYEALNRQRNGGFRTNSTVHNTGSACGGCDICSGLLCADCCCECFGGDLIPCC